MPVAIEPRLVDPTEQVAGRIVRILDSKRMEDFLIYDSNPLQGGPWGCHVWRMEPPPHFESYWYIISDFIWKSCWQPATLWWLSLEDGIDEMKRTRDYRVLKAERQRLWDELLAQEPLPRFTGENRGAVAGSEVSKKYNRECVGPINILLPKRDLTGWFPPCPNGWGRKKSKPGELPTLHEQITAAIEATRGWGQ